MASSFYLNNFTTSIINTQNKIIMSVHCVYFTNSPIYLTLFPSPFANRATPFLFVNICFCFFFVFFFLRKRLLCYNVFTGYFAFNFGLFCLGSIWFLLELIIFSWSCSSFFLFLQGELLMISDFSPHRFGRLTNFGTFKLKKSAILLWILPVLTINNLKKS